MARNASHENLHTQASVKLNAESMVDSQTAKMHLFDYERPYQPQNVMWTSALPSSFMGTHKIISERAVDNRDLGDPLSNRMS